MKHVLIDTDPGVDDALALLLAFAARELDIVALTVVFGNVALERCLDNTRRVLRVAGVGRPPPLHAGADGPLSGTPRDSTHVFSDDGLGGVTRLVAEDGATRYPAFRVDEERTPADEAIVDAARRYGADLTVIALGPLTNVARAHRLDRDALRSVREIVIMGGAFHVPGNVTPAAEFNIHCDPLAAREVCGSAARLRWVPLDATRQAALREPDLHGRTSRRGEFVRAITRRQLSGEAPEDGEAQCLLHDPLAVGAVLWPELLQWTPMHVRVICDQSADRGRTIGELSTAAATRSRVALGVDADEFRRRFLAALDN